MRTSLLPLALSLALLTACGREAVCPQGQLPCGGTCTAVLTDVQNCGACGVTCATGETCGGGHCLCADGRADCGGTCADLASDPGHCGACGTACAAGLYCTTSAAATSCASSCAAGQTACGYACVDLNSDPFHCGACGRACGSLERCVNQECMADLYLACADTDQLAEATLGLSPAGATRTVGTRPVSLAWLGGALFSANSVGGNLSELQLDLPAPTPVAVTRTIPVDTTSAYPDLEYVAAQDGLLYVSNAALANLDIIDDASGLVITASHLGLSGDIFTSPAGIALVGGKAYVALNGADAIAVVDVSQCQATPPACAPSNDCTAYPGTACVNGRCVPTGCGNVLPRISLPSSMASTATGPTPYRLLTVGMRLYVTLQNLDRANGYLPAGPGRLAVIDTTSDTLVQDVSGPLTVLLGSACVNPGGLALVGDTLYVACGYYDFYGTGAKSGMAIVPVSLASGTPVVQAAVPTTSVLGPIAGCGGALYAGASDTGTVVRYDLVTGRLSGALLCPQDVHGNAYVSDLACHL